MQKPLYRSVADVVKTRIATGYYPCGSPLPPEPKLQQEFNVSRITVRQALGLLKQRGLLVARSGRGTIVRNTQPEPDALQTTGPLSDLTYYAKQTAYESLGQAVVGTSAKIRELFGKDSPACVHRYRGTRSTARYGVFCYEEVFVPEDLGNGVDNRDLDGRTIFSLLEETNNFEIAEVTQRLAAVGAPGRVSSHLGIPRGKPTLRAIRVYKTAADRTVEVVVVHYNTQGFEYGVTLYPD